MPEKNTEKLFEIYFNEYNQLKNEQISRIGFRDNLIYVTLTLFGGILSYALSDTNHYPALLIIPWVCFILGWTYLVNDQKISAIGQYIRLNLSEKIENLIDSKSKKILGWETEHRDDHHRKSRKYTQLIVDLITFCFAGIISLLLFIALTTNLINDYRIISICLFETLLLVYLGYWIIIYADLKKGRAVKY
jgi:1,4-dihydroxy-2-naphthoate octaprenyltransferase